MGKVGNIILDLGLAVIATIVAGPQAGAVFFLRALSALLAQDFTAKQQGLLINLPSNEANLPVVYGTALLGALPVDIRVDPASADQTDLYLVLALCHGSQDGNGIHGIQDIWLDRRTALDASHVVQPPFTGVISRVLGGGSVGTWLALLSTYLGTYSQTADSTLKAKFPQVWDSSMQGAGVAYLILKATFHEALYSGVPNVLTLVQGNRVYDPRDMTWKFSDNPALCIYDFLTAPIYGLGADSSELDTQSFIDAANYCDDTVVVSGKSYSPRYACDGWLDTSRAPQDSLTQLLSSCRGQLIYEGGVFRLVIRDTASPVSFALTPDNIVGNFTFSTPGQADAYNLVRLTFAPAVGPQWVDGGAASTGHAAGGLTDATRSWTTNQFVGGTGWHLWITGGTGYDETSTGYPITSNSATQIVATGCPATDATTTYMITQDGTHSAQASLTDVVQYPDPSITNTYLADDEGYEATLDLALPCTPQWWQALQIGQILLKESRYGVACSLTAREEAIQLQVGDVVNVTHPTPGWTAKPFWVTGMGLNADLTVQISLVEYQDAAYAMDGLAQPPIIPETNLPNPFSVGVPTSVALTADATTLLQTDDGTVIPRIHVTWVPPSHTFLNYTEVIARLDGTNPWTVDVKVPAYESPQEVYLPGVQEGQTWDVWVRAVNLLGVKSAWVQGTVAITSSLPESLLPHVGGKEDAVLNGLFEDGGITAFWKPYSSADVGHFSAETGSPFDGTTSLKVDVHPSASCYVEQALGVLAPGASGARTYVRVNPGEVWRVHAALKTSIPLGATAFAIFGATLWTKAKVQMSGGIVNVAGAVSSQSTTWAEFDHTITIPAGCYYITPVCSAQWDPSYTSFSAYFDNLHIYRLKASDDIALTEVATGAKAVVLTNYPGSAAASSPPSKWVLVNGVLVPGWPQ